MQAKDDMDISSDSSSSDEDTATGPMLVCPSTRIRIHSSIQDLSVNIVNRACAIANFMCEFGFVRCFVLSSFLLLLLVICHNRDRN